ncbi:MAG: CRISPR-associated helicase Cas3' [Thermoanaerobacterales bacterium]|nr:CRISPR-associated helicase Cas3' [Thermoanaerobacterales bacterium]
MGDSQVSLYRFQEEAAAALLNGASIILRAPTGAGKTWAVLLPFLLAKQIGRPVADRVLYALPLRSLASQLYASTLDSCRRAGWVVHSSKSHETGLSISIQTGEQQDDPFFQGDIVFTTIDQLLSSYLLSPVSLPSRLANINAGALIGSLVVFDEFHLLDPDRSMVTTIEMLDRLRLYCQFVLMTATLSDFSVQWLANRLGARVISPSDAEFASLEKRKKRGPTRRKWIVEQGALTAEAVLSEHLNAGGGRTLVLVNTVDRAQELYKELSEKLSEVKKEGVRLSLLHSRFYREDRMDKEQDVVDRLGKSSQDMPENFILISTQVVEAGMDFSVDALHTELAPMNSLVQRAGRCARYGGDGAVKVYALDSYPPYGEAEMAGTWAVLTAMSGEVLTAQDEQRAVDEVHGPIERRVLESINLNEWRTKINKTMDGILRNAHEELIRDVDSINVLVIAEPEKVRFDRQGEWPETLSVPTRFLRGFLKRVAGDETGNWVAKVPVAADAHGGEQYAGLRFDWKRFEPGETALTWLVAIHPDHAHYSRELGLRLGEAGERSKVRYVVHSVQACYHYRCETYVEHIRLALEELYRLSAAATCARKRLADETGVPGDIIQQAERLAVILHDTGKLGVKWQEQIKAWQKAKTPDRALDEPLAHSDYDPETDWEPIQKHGRRPNHAVEGAYAASVYLYDLFPDRAELAACVLTAVARHHKGDASTLQDFRLIPNVAAVMNPLLSGLGLPPVQRLADQPDPDLCGKNGRFSRELVAALREEDRPWLPLYWHLVRLLRLADQAGSAKGGRNSEV